MPGPKVVPLTTEQATQIATLKAAQVQTSTAAGIAGKAFQDYIKTLTGNIGIARVQISDDGKNLIIG